MKYIIAIIGLFATSNINAQGLISQDSATIASLIDSVVTANFTDAKIPGSVISVVHRGKVVLNNGYGVEDMETQKPINPNTSKFRVASITKTFTALAIMEFIEDGRLLLDADIHAYLPEEEYQFDAPYSFTIHDLLTHTAGFEWSSVRVSNEAIADERLETFVKTSMNKQVWEPGEIFYYSNKGYGILGLLIEKLSGMRYEDYMNEFILPKFGMNNSTTYQHTATKTINNIVTPYRYVDNEFVEIPRQHVVNPAASTLNTTGKDMAQFMMGMLGNKQHNGTALLEDATHKQMTTTQFHSVVPEQGMAYGMGVGYFNGFRSLSHGGGIEGFGSFYTIYPELELGIFMSESGGENQSWFVFKNIFDALGKLVKDQNIEDEILPSDLNIIDQAENVAGLYQMATVTQSSFEKGQRIFGIDEKRIAHVGNGKLKVDDRIFIPTGKFTYKAEAKDSNRKLGFQLDENGQVQYMGYGNIYSTFQKISWLRSALALQIALGLGLLLALAFLIIYPIFGSNTIPSPINKRYHNWIKWTVGLLLGGFTVLLIGNMLNWSMTTGTAIGFKIGLTILTLGAVLALATPYITWQLWKLNTPRKYKMLQTLGLIGLVLVCICFWDINLIGMKWY